MKQLPAVFYSNDDVVAVGRQLLGKVLCTSIGDSLTKAIITETEAYAGQTDRASHAWGGRRTKRTEPMYAAGGVAYVYLCYGLHHLFNVVTGPAGVPHAVLVRAGIPVGGVDTMLLRRNKSAPDKSLLGGPGSMSKALGITTDLTGTSLRGNRVWIEDHGHELPESAIRTTPRIGVDYAGKDALLPYPFLVDTVGYSLRPAPQDQARDA